MYGPISTNKIRVLGKHGRIVENLFESFTTPLVTDSPDFSTWEVSRNRRGDGSYWDDELRIENTNNARAGQWWSPDVVLAIGAGIDYTMPDPSLCPSGAYRHRVKNATNTGSNVTVKPFASETFYVSRGSPAATSVTIAPGASATFRLDKNTGNWVVL